MRATFLSLLVGIAGGVALSSAAVFSSFVAIAVVVAQEPPSPIHHTPKRPSFQWATDGFCKPFSNDCRIANLGGTR